MRFLRKSTRSASDNCSSSSSSNYRYNSFIESCTKRQVYPFYLFIPNMDGICHQITECCYHFCAWQYSCCCSTFIGLDLLDIRLKLLPPPSHLSHLNMPYHRHSQSPVRRPQAALGLSLPAGKMFFRPKTVMIYLNEHQKGLIIY